jgi:hypothetical protein
MSLPQLQLTEPLVAAMVDLLQANLNANIAAFNQTIPGDPYQVPQVQQILPFVPVPSTLQGGMPAVGVQRLGGTFVNDMQYNMDADHRYAVVAIIQNADHQTLVHQLERMLECVAYTIHQDRLVGVPHGSQSLLKSQGGAWAVDFEDYSPGPLLGDLDPTDHEAPPRTYLSWVALTLLSRRTEVS